MMILLQAAPTPEQIEATRDSIRAGAKMMIETAKSDPETFWQEVGTATLHFGIKVLVALLIFVIGILLIRWIQHLLNLNWISKHMCIIHNKASTIKITDVSVFRTTLKFKNKGLITGKLELAIFIYKIKVNKV